MSDLQKRLEKLSPAQRELVLKKLQAQKQSLKMEDKAKALAITPVSREQPIPLSWNQQRLWFLEQLEGSSSAYNIPAAVDIAGNLNLAALEQAMKEIIRRHEVLRTSFSQLNGIPVQTIAPHLSLTIPVIDLKDLSKKEQSESVKRLVNNEVQKPFDLSKSPLLRVNILRLSENSHVMLLTMHHIISDGWSVGILISELSTLYRSFLLGIPSSLPELPFQYADFAAWQRQRLSGKVLETQLNYWKETLLNIPALLELPTDRPRPPVKSFCGSSEKIELSSELTKKLQSLAQQTGATLFMILSGALATLLYRYTEMEDICIGTPIANRHREETESIIGFFVNTLVLRTNLKDNPSFAELIKQVRQKALEAYEHQDVPFEQVVEALQPERSLSYSPLFQVMFALQNAPMGKLELPGLTLKPLSVDSVTAKFDLTISMWSEVEGLQGTWEYNSDLFDTETISRMTGHFQTLLAGIVANPDKPIGELPLQTDAENQQLLFSWNNTKTGYPADESIADLFEQQVNENPDAIAVTYAQEQLTYQQLNSRANQLAHYLQNQGVSSEVLVGLCVERSLEAIVAILGILKAGGTYVPFEPDYPQERLDYMLSDSQVSVLITQSKLLPSLLEHQAQIVCLDTDWETISTYSSDNLNEEIKPTNLAYVIYTSGSTGKPKGVAAIQQAVIRLVFETNYVQIQPDDIIAQASNISFDAATFEIWGALLQGAKLVGITKEVMLSPEELAQQLRVQKITILFVTTALFNQLVSVVPDLFSHLRTVLFGGEAVDPYWVSEVLKKGPPQRLIHVYGPTESTTFSTWYLVESVPEGATNIPIGSPISNTTIYVLDRHVQPVPVGVTGELYIGGDGLARGYLNRPELTAAKFITDPWNSDGRLYKTGDLVRYLPDGNIQFKGRIDNQVKIRGFRIELGEIEAILSQHPQVREAVVIVRENQPGNKRLTAYLLPYSEKPTSTALRGFLKERLPEYMVPAAFVIMEAFPLTPNGKVDCCALKAPDTESDANLGDSGYVAPRTPIEETLVAIWSEILRVKKVGVCDNFFTLGGDSIISIQIIARANQAGLHLTPKQLFQHQTIAELAAVASTSASIQATQDGVTGLAPLTPIQHWFFQQNLPASHHFNQSVLLSVPNNLEPERLERAVQKIIVHHDALRLQFTQKEAGWQQVYTTPDDQIPLRVVDLSDISIAQQLGYIQIIADETQASLSLSAAPLIRVVLFQLAGSSPGRLLLVIHHLVVDGVSWRILIEDLLKAYQKSDINDKLSIKTTSFKDWALRLTEYAQSEKLLKELNYWLTQFPREIDSIPMDYPQVKNANTFASSRTVSVSLTEEETRTLLQEVPKAYNTQINDVLLTALVQSLAKFTSSKSLLVDLEGHGREELFTDVDLSRTVGWFTTCFPVYLQLESIDNLSEALKSIKEQLRSIPSKGIGYGIGRYLSNDADIREKLEAQPQAQISFNYLGQFTAPTGLQSESMGWSIAQESSGINHSPLGTRAHLLDINGLVVASKLQIDYIYSENIHKQTTIESLAIAFIEALKSLINHCSSPEAGGYTPSDFSAARLSQQQLDSFLAKIKKKKS